MKSKLKTSLLAILLTLLAVCTLLSCIQVFNVGNIASAAIQPTGEQGDTHVTITSDTTAIARGGSITFTITVMPSAERQSLEWYSVNLDLTPLTASLTADTSLYSYLSGTDEKIVDPAYSDLSNARFVTGGRGYVFGYGWNATTGLQPKLANTPLVKKITVTLADNFPEDITTMTWGFAHNVAEKVVYCKDGVKSAGAEDRAKVTSTKYGQLSYETLTINIVN